MKNIKIIYVLSVIIIVAGVVCTAIMGFNYGTNYSEAKKITIYIGKEYKMQEIKEIVEEVLGKGSKIYQEVEEFTDTVSVTVKDVADVQLDELNNKIKEKFSLEDDNVVTTINVPHQMLRDIVKPYIKPFIITTIVLWVIMAIAMKIAKTEQIITRLIMAFVNLVLAEAVYVSAFSITRLPINELFIIGVLAVYILATTSSLKFKVSLASDEKKK